MKIKMKTKILIAILSIGLFSTTSMLSQEKVDNKTSHKQMEKTVYTCPMHADVKSDKPGDCPKCGMPLKAIDAKKAATKHSDMSKKGSCCPKQTNESTTKSSCTRKKEVKSTE